MLYIYENKMNVQENFFKFVVKKFVLKEFWKLLLFYMFKFGLKYNGIV